MKTIIFLLSCATSLLLHPCAFGIGVNYGLLGDNLPPPTQVIALLKSRGITRIRLFEPNSDILNAMHDSDIEVILGIHNEDLQQLATNPSFSQSWVAINVLPHAEDVRFTCIAAGNEVIPGSLQNYVLGAMQNIDNAIKAAHYTIKVSTAVSIQVLGTSYPPSAGAFAKSTTATMSSIVGFLASNGYPLLLNAYPYFAYNGDPTNVRLDYALFQDTAPPAPDGQFTYYNLFDAMVDATYAALEKTAGGGNVEIVVAESGWPSAGNGAATTIENAQIYNQNMINHVTSGKGTPRRPNGIIETYVFALFNEDLKPAGAEQNFGLYHPDMSEVYHVDFPR